MTVPEIVQNLQSSDLTVKFMAVQNARKILSRERSPPIEALIAAGTVPLLVQCLTVSDKYVYLVLKTFFNNLLMLEMLILVLNV